MYSNPIVRVVVQSAVLHDEKEREVVALVWCERAGGVTSWPDAASPDAHLHDGAAALVTNENCDATALWRCALRLGRRQ